ncbi:MAG: NUDIX domain-containing protein [Alphaproteobacteria bacterium GM202ARS2]|nr:NUDIX domain-containing protein [Alphaproteobacteria bacterium GM202ARS2]
MIHIVNGLLIQNGHVLMALRAASRHTYPGTWSFPGGHVENGETFPAALTRELKEEIGVRPLSETHLATLTDEANGLDSNVAFHLYAVEAWRGEPTNLGDEHERLSWLSLEEAKDMPNLALEAYREVLRKLQCQKS